MDQHFAQAPLEQNLPMCLGLLDVGTGISMGTTAVASPYHHGLRRLPTYLQQLVMESNGSGVWTPTGALGFSTSEVVWGEPGTNGQHAFSKCCTRAPT